MLGSFSKRLIRLLKLVYEVEQCALMSPNPIGKLKDLVVGCVCVV